MEGKRVLVKNEWYTVLDKVLVEGSLGGSVTNYLVRGEKDQMKLIFPEDIEVIE